MKYISKFNESRKYQLSKDLIEDIFVEIEDLGAICNVRFGYSDGSAWDFEISEFLERGKIESFGWIIQIELDILDIQNVDDFSNFSKIVKNMESIFRKFEKYYCNVSISLNNYSENFCEVFLKKSPKLEDLYFITYEHIECFEGYFTNYDIQIESFDENGVIFISEAKDIEEFEKKLMEACSDDEFDLKWNEIKKIGSKFLVKNLIDTNIFGDDLKNIIK